MAKDPFSNQADLYARYRPVYPKELYDYIFSIVKETNIAWDCATGNGQAAVVLAERFAKVIATDISPAQISKATLKENIEYKNCAAEDVLIENNSIDLVTVAQAYHWINWDKFKTEVTRVCRNGASIAIWMYYNPFSGDKNVDALSRHFYKNITGPYWDDERKYVDDLYSTVKFDYDEINEMKFSSILKWKRKDFIGYVSSWSAIQNYININGDSPVPHFDKELSEFWNDNEIKKIMFPIYLKSGVVRK